MIGHCGMWKLHGGEKAQALQWKLLVVEQDALRSVNASILISFILNEIACYKAYILEKQVLQRRFWTLLTKFPAAKSSSFPTQVV